ncbi:uncharacterized protein LOC119736088 [Patiria miniata]|uniref:Uncharacterized protein n=1 Tax=Patiria miniata TaxID=46514 RepID=A0A914AQI3_PATMI|nr:uncharacterized protein LOC119736088 [Patiria miniata]
MAHAIYAVVVLSLVQISKQVTRGDWELSVTTSPSESILEGSDVTLTCLITSNQASTGWVQWQHSPNGASFFPLTEPTYTVSSNNLTLTGVSRNQTGWYRCVGTSVWTSNYWNPNTFSDSTAVEVLYPPEITNKDRTWTGANDNYTATLECIVRSNPLPRVTWYGPNDTIITHYTNPDRIFLEDTITGSGAVGYLIVSHLIITPVANSTDYGMYRCRAANNISTYDEHEIELTETGKPEPPRDLQVYYSTENDVWVTWEPGYDGGEELYAHYINIRKIPWDFDAGGWIERWPPTITKGFFSYLEQGTLYQVAVYALNTHGASSYATVDVRTKPASPDKLGIRVTYNQAHRIIMVTGMPKDNYDGTCLRLIGYDTSQGEWVSLRPDLDCIQRDGEFEYSGPNSGHIHSRYCHDGLCSSQSHVTEDYPTTARPPLPTWPKHGGNTADNVGVIIGVSLSVGIVLLLLSLGVCRYLGCFRDCNKPISLPSASDNVELTRHAPLASGAEPYQHGNDSPPTYTEALEMIVTAGNSDNPPPAYEYVSSLTTDRPEYFV